MEILIGNGNCLVQILIHGFTENVCLSLSPFHLLRCDFTFVAGAGKSMLWYVDLLAFLSDIYGMY